MPIAIPPPDIDPTVMPPVSTQPTEAETMENGIAAADEAASAGMPQSRESVAAGLSKLWVDPNPRAR
ncbi:hypothetical protein SAMN05444679_1133 [Variovorax sp. CF079]|uniref:hypothetical protein n=1 Tax=Variovorax sp. CF079 TaxID=1882774 RepID=UPI00088DC01F|nr:hypothetical protein [Variovorax sp. CF079]SDD71478.1 hypothetical protein SAMN05444679_1133 [Variovorax sp. CF079]